VAFSQVSALKPQSGAIHRAGRMLGARTSRPHSVRSTLSFSREIPLQPGSGLALIADGTSALPALAISLQWDGLFGERGDTIHEITLS